MKIIIIEDELYTAKDLENCILELRSDFEILCILPSVKEALAFLKSTNNYNLIFSDIQLNDGLSFEIFKSIQVSAPVIFCTAYDNYAIDAFKANGIDYVLKPINKASIKAAIEKYERLVKPAGEVNENMHHLLQLLNNNTPQKSQSALLVHYKDKIIPQKIDAVSLFYLHNDSCRLINSDGQQFNLHESLDKIEELCGTQFFRANRQFLVNRNAVAEVVQHFSRKHLLKLNFNFDLEISISKERTPALLNWLKEN